MPQIADWPPTRADAQHILNQHPDSLPEHIHTCKVCNDTYWGQPATNGRIRSFCSKRCYHKHRESSPSFKRYRVSPKGKAMRQKIMAKQNKSPEAKENALLRARQFSRWQRVVYTLDPSQKPQSPWATCSTPDCHNIPTKKRARSCSACMHDARVANRPNTWRNAGKPCVECSKPLQRYQGKFCSHTCSKRHLSRSKRKRNPEKYRNSKRLQRQRASAKKRATKLELQKSGAFIRPCNTCDEPFDSFSFKGKTPTFCSKRCQNKADHERRRARKRAAFIEVVSVKKLAKWQSWRCYLCKGIIDKDARSPHPKSLSLDHLVPLSLGGEHSYRNCAAAHLGCNSRKQAKAMNEQLKLV